MFRKPVKALAFFMVFCFACALAPAARALEVSAKSAVLYDAVSHRILFEKNADARLPVASTTKTMTALIVLENAQLTDIVTIKREHTLPEGSSMYLRAGEKLSVEALLYGLLLMSGNDAAVALADYCGGMDGFTAKMNDKAAELGLLNTHFTNPHGLDDEQHYSTARDMAVLSCACMENAVFREIVSTRAKSVAGRYMTNHNRLLKTLRGAQGIKTGFTKRSGRCLLSSAERAGQRLIAVTLNAPNDWRDHTELYEYGFSAYSTHRPVSAGDVVHQVPVVSGDASFVGAAASESVHLCLTDAEYQRLVRAVELPRFVYAPVNKGATIGCLRYILDGKTLAQTPLICDNSISCVQPVNPGILRRILNFFVRVASAVGI